jgi:uncharacterized protein DUF6883
MAEGRSTHPHALPNYQNAEIASEKLEGYALNANHKAARPGGSSGKDKARVFKAALGFDQSNWEILKRRLLDELPYHEAVFEAERKDWGKAYRVDMPILGVNGITQNVRTAWIVKHGKDHPSLVTLLVLP